MLIFGAVLTIFDKKEKIEDEIYNKIKNLDVKFSLGENYLSNLNEFHLIVRSPSCMPNIKELLDAKENGTKVTSEIELLMELSPASIIAVTGSDGKTTTTSLIYEIIKKEKENTYLGGNIGIPLFAKISEIKKEDIIVLELSSFQLMELKVSPKIAVVTNVTPNHLDIHKSYEEYIEAKKNIFKNQDNNGKVVLNYDNEITKEFAKKANGNVEYFSSKNALENGVVLDKNIIKICKNKCEEEIIDVNNIFLRGKHMYENICAAIAVTKDLVNIETIVEVVKNFKGVEHRLEFVREINNVKIYNDSIGSSPTRTIAGIKAFEEEIILIAGGYDKNLDYTELGKEIVTCNKVKTVILMGNTAKKICEAIQMELDNKNKELEIYLAGTLEDAVKHSVKSAKPRTNNIIFASISKFRYV